MSPKTKVSLWLGHDGYRDPGDALALLVEGVHAKAVATEDARISIDWFAFDDDRPRGLDAKDAAKPSPPVLEETAIAKVLRVFPDTGPGTGPDPCPDLGDPADPLAGNDWIGNWTGGLDYL